MIPTSDRLTNLERRMDAQNLSPEDKALFVEMKNVYIGVQQWGRFTRLIIIILGLIAASIAAWDVVLAKAGELLK